MLSKKYWLLPLISGVAMAFAFLGDSANKIAEVIAAAFNCEISDAQAWFFYDMGNEINTAIGWTVALIFVPYLRITFAPRMTLYYGLLIWSVYSWIDVGDEIFNGNTRTFFLDGIYLACSFGYGLASFALWRTFIRSSDIPRKGCIYAIVRPPKSLTGVIPFLLKRKTALYCNGKIWVRSKHGYELPVIYRPVRGDVLYYSGHERELISKIDI